jgi:predicted transposase YbfD/YdcC
MTRAKPEAEADHGRIETRTATLCSEIQWLRKDHQWPGLTAVGKVVRIRKTLATMTTETAYYRLSQILSTEPLNEVVRSHRGVENRLHWRLDVVMNQEQDRTQLARIAWRFFDTGRSTSCRRTKRKAHCGKFKPAGWDDAYLTSVVALF